MRSGESSSFWAKVVGRAFGGGLLNVALSIGIGLALCGPAGAASPRESLAFWKNNYDTPDPAANPAVGNAYRIFGSLLDVAGSRPGIIPTLLVIRDRSLRVMALPDGGIVLSTAAIDLCNALPEYAEDRLAFVLAHEIAHQLKDDFWHMRFFEAVDARESVGESCEDCREIAGRTDDDQAKELQADEHAIIYSAMAGYDARAIVGGDGGSFFTEWNAAVNPGRVAAASAGTHPESAQRADVIAASLNAVVEHLAAYELGVLFLEAGMNHEASLAFRAFLPYFPGREVYNNLAVAHYRAALALYIRLNDAPAFALDVITDPSSIAAGIFRSSGDAPDGLFEIHAARAIEYFETAASQDSTYRPAYLGLAAALILDRRPVEARAAIEKGIRINGESADLVNALGVAFYYDEMVERAGRAFATARELDPGYAAAGFNMARLAALQGDSAAANEALAEFLASQPNGYWAGIAAGLLTGDGGERDADVRVGQAEAIAGVEAGFYTDEVPAEWGSPSTILVNASESPYGINHYSNGVVAVHYLGEIILLSASDSFAGRTAMGISSGDSATVVTEAYGSPDASLRVGQSDVWQYAFPGIAFRIRGDRVVSWLVYTESPLPNLF